LTNGAPTQNVAPIQLRGYKVRQYILKPQVGIVLNLEYAHGKDGNYGVLLKNWVRVLAADAR